VMDFPVFKAIQPDVSSGRPTGVMHIQKTSSNRPDALGC